MGPSCCGGLACGAQWLSPGTEAPIRVRPRWGLGGISPGQGHSRVWAWGHSKGCQGGLCPC